MRKAQRVIEVIGGSAIAIVVAVWLFGVSGGGAKGFGFVAVVAAICAVLALVDHRRAVRARAVRSAAAGDLVEELIVDGGRHRPPGQV